MNTKLVFFDSETSGTNPKIHQMLSFAMYMTDLELNPLKTLNYNIQLRPDAVVDKGALAINKLNPYSKDWNDKSISERELRGEIISFCDDISSDILFLAYNAAFDRDFAKACFSQADIELSSVLKGALIDPMIGAKYCTKNRLILTELKQNTRGQWYHAFNLQAVSHALKTQSVGEAHNALNDCLTLAPTTKEIYEKQFKMDFAKTFKTNSKAWKIG